MTKKEKIDVMNLSKEITKLRKSYNKMTQATDDKTNLIIELVQHASELQEKMKAVESRLNEIELSMENKHKPLVQPIEIKTPYPKGYKKRFRPAKYKKSYLNMYLKGIKKWINQNAAT